MAQTAASPKPVAPAAPAGAGRAVDAAPSGGGAPTLSSIDWKAVWPIPVLALAVTALAGGLVVGFMKAPKDDPAAPLEVARAQVEGTDYEGAIRTLNGQVMTPMQQGLLNEAQQGDFFLLRARSIYQGQDKLGVKRAENYKAVLSDYERAEALHAHLNHADEVARVVANLELGRVDEAVALARALPASLSAQKIELFKRIILSNLASSDVHYEQSLALLGDLMEQPGLPVEDRGWAAARQTELRLAMGYADEAITRLLRLMPSLGDLPAAARGELLYLLGEAYYMLGQLAPAQRQLEIAMKDLPALDPLRADAMVLSARILQAGNQVDEARELFAQVYTDFPDARATLPALLGKAETTSAQGEDDAAEADFEALLEQMKAGVAPRRDLTPAGVGRSLMDRHIDRFTRGEFKRALQYALLAERAYRLDHTGEGDAGDPVPAEVHLAVGVSHRRLADQILEEARTTDQGRVTIDAVSPVTAAEAKRHLLDAGGAYREHARAVVTIDTQAYLTSLWSAADAFDAAGDREAARDSFQAYIDGAGDDDPRRPEAKFRLAQAFQAERQFSTAASIYRELIAGRTRRTGDAPATPAAGANFVGPPAEERAEWSREAGLWADRAVVPLARCYLADDQTSNDEEAEELLRAVLSGRAFSPDALEYRDALTELGEHAYGQGRMSGDEGAIRLLEEAVERYPDHPRRAVLVFKLADASRQLGVSIGDELHKQMPSAERARLSEDRQNRHRSAMKMYQQVIDAVNARPARMLTDLDKLLRRNAMFYLGDCALELGDQPLAIKLYDAAAQAYASDPASLVARVQIVRAYVEQGRWAEAMTANERAKRQLAALPEGAMEDPNLPMQRRHWEKWLESDALLQQRRQAQGGGGNGGAGRGGRED